MFLKGRFTKIENFIDSLLTTTSMEALATFSNPCNCPGVLHLERIQADSTTEAYGGHVLDHKKEMRCHPGVQKMQPSNRLDTAMSVDTMFLAKIST